MAALAAAIAALTLLTGSPAARAEPTVFQADAPTADCANTRHDCPRADCMAAPAAGGQPAVASPVPATQSAAAGSDW